MIFLSQLTVGVLQAREVDIALDSQDLVIIALGGVHCFFTATFTMAGRSRRPRKLYPGWYSSKNRMIFHVVGLQHVNRMMQVGIEFQPLRANRLQAQLLRASESR